VLLQQPQLLDELGVIYDEEFRVGVRRTRSKGHLTMI